MSWIQTFTGKRFDLRSPRAEDVCIEDISHALANICRFNGHTTRFYSVAEHSLRVAELLPDELKLAGLLHDAVEAYVGDVVAPFKRYLEVGFPKCATFADFESRILRLIFEKFEIEWPLAPAVHEADRVLRATEKRDLMTKCEHEWDEELPPPLPEEIPTLNVGPWASRREFTREFSRLRECVTQEAAQ